MSQAKRGGARQWGNRRENQHLGSDEERFGGRRGVPGSRVGITKPTRLARKKRDR